MLGDTQLSKQFRNVMKIFGVAIAVYLALTVKVWLTGETDEVSQFDYLQSEQNLEDVLADLDNSIDWSDELEHWSSSAFSKLCSSFKIICDKIKRSGVFTDEDKTLKFAYTAYLLQNLDKNIKYWDVPSWALLSMLINDKKWSRRWSANRNTITINLWWMKYDNEFFQVISHEMGHIVDLWWLQWKSKSKSSTFTEFEKVVFSIDDPSLEYYRYSRSSEKIRKSWMTKEDFCSWYGMSDPFEDFAECHNLYLNHHDYFRELAINNSTLKNKYNYFSNLYGGKYLNNSEAKYENRSNSYRAWDTTKLREW